jgi:voltage-gated potassium channel Kch
MTSANALQIIDILLVECDTFANFWDHYKILVPVIIFAYLAYFLLLVMVVYNVNDLLRQQHGHNPSYVKYIYGSTLVVVGGVTVGLIVLECWSYFNNFVFAGPRIRLAFYVLYMLAVIIASVMAAATIFSMRSRGTSNRVSSPSYLSPSCTPLTRSQNLITWTGAVMFSMLFWIILSVAQSAAYFSFTYLGDTTYQAFYWLENIFKAFAWICLLFIAKSNVLGASTGNAVAQVYNAQNPAYDPVPVPQQQQLPYTVHNGAPPPPQQHAYYSQQ